MSSIRNEFFKYIKGHKLALLISAISASLVIPPLPSSYPLYYAVLAYLFIYSAISPNIKINAVLIWFYIAALLSIVIGSPNPVFKPYGRLGLFLLLTGAVFPLFSSYKADKLRLNICGASIRICILIGLVSFICYFLGINYMQMRWDITSINEAGVFAGITNQSMMLAPICMIGIIYLSTVLLYKTTRKWLITGMLISLVLTLFIAASRSAFVAALVGVLIAVILRYWENKSKIYKLIFVIGLISIVTYPLYSDFSSILIDKQIQNQADGGTFASRDIKWSSRMTEFSRNPISGIGFASVDWSLEPETANPEGVVEPGSSWLAVLSMTGILGAVPVFVLIISILRRLFKFTRIHQDFNSCVLFCIISGQIVHQFAEGYGLAAGSFLCYLFWLMLGTGYSYPSLYTEMKQRKLVIDRL